MDEYLQRFKNKKRIIKNTKLINIKIILSKFLIAIIFFLSSLIYTNTSDNNLALYKEKVFSSTIPFMKLKNIYENLFGNILKENREIPVFNEKLVYKSINNYLDGEELTLNKNELINNISSGVVVYIGEKEGYNNTVIIQGIDGYDIWYGNLNNIAVKLYDYVEKNNVLGQTIDDKLYLVIKKDNEYIKYEEYQNK